MVSWRMRERDSIYTALATFPVFFLPGQLVSPGVLPELALVLFVLVGSGLVFLATRRNYERSASGTFMTLYWLFGYATMFAVLATMFAHHRANSADGLLFASYTLTGSLVLLTLMMFLGAIKR